ncbi:hypothetical protein F2P81_013775 [Scophthalmus maximus]|uniref:Uncharacterized protein n=1 Tax=Scophthalmus maximus TaxID=52904 RepID=A0A6A4SM65_SCOMX|nr:hypothetical protein F2P81_013775 [Scophthalmus maximus]
MHGLCPGQYLFTGQGGECTVPGRGGGARCLWTFEGRHRADFWLDAGPDLPFCPPAEDLLYAPEDLLYTPEDLLYTPEDLLYAPEDLLYAPEHLLYAPEDTHQSIYCTHQRIYCTHQRILSQLLSSCGPTPNEDGV